MFILTHNRNSRGSLRKYY